MDGLERRDHGRVRALRLSRPPSNGLSLALLDALLAELDAAAGEASVRAVVLGSAVPKYFSSGLDLEELLSLPEPERPRLFERMVAVHRRLARLGKPTVAAMEGSALLGGFILALGCDWRLLARETGRVALSEIRIGLSPTTPLLRLVSSLSGRPGIVKDLVLRGATLRAEEAYEAGLVDRLLPAEGFWDEALREAERLAKLPPGAYAAIQGSLRSALLEDRLWGEGMREFYALFDKEEAREGLLAMRDKRKPRWE